MKKARLTREIIIPLANDAKVLDSICSMIAEMGVGVLATHTSIANGIAAVRLVTNEHHRLSETLRERGYSPRETDCVLVEMANQPAALCALAGSLADESIRVQHLYTTCAETERTRVVVFSCTDNARAVDVLNRLLVSEPSVSF